MLLDPIHFEMKMQKSIPNNAKVYYVNLNLNFQPALGRSKQHQGLVAQSMVGFNHWLSSIKTNTFSRY